MLHSETAKNTLFLIKSIITDYLFFIVRNLKFFLPIMIISFIQASFWQLGVLSLLSKGLNIGHSGMMVGHYYMVLSLLVIPSGWIADKWNKKFITCVGYVALFLSGVCIAFGNDIYKSLGMIFFGIGTSFITIPQKIFVLDTLRSSQQGSVKTKGDIFNCFEICKRSTMIAGAFISWRLLNISNSLPWLVWSVLSILAIITVLRLPKSQPNLSVSPIPKGSSLSLIQVFKSIVVITAMILSGIEMGIRSIILNPYLTHILTGDIASLQLNALIQAFSGIFGTILYKFIDKKLENSSYFGSKENQAAFFVALSMMIYSCWDMICAFTKSYSIFLSTSAIAIVTMGWYFPLLDSLVEESSDTNWRSRALSFVSIAQNASAGITLYILNIIEISIEDIRQYWAIGSVFLFTGSLFIFLIPLQNIVSARKIKIAKSI